MASYQFEVWNGVTTHTMDITSLVKNVRYSIERNNSEKLDFDMDLADFEKICSSIGELPSVAIRNYTTDIKVKRNGQYLFGTQVGEIVSSADENGVSISISCDGYLSLLADRYVAKTYTQMDGADIAWDMIDYTNNINISGTGTVIGDTGIRRGLVYNTGMLRDRTFVRQNIKDAIINLTQLESNVFDFSFSFDRTFNTYQKIGSDRPDITLSYPASEKGINAINLKVPKQARGALYNQIIGVGAGFGDEALQASYVNQPSATIFGVRQKIVTYNDITNINTLNENILAELHRTFDVLRLPQFVVSGNDFDLNDIKVGDRIQALQTKYDMMKINGTYRIEKLDVSLDENFSETITVTLDNYQI